ncbi:MAG: hypothetical protein KGL39_07815 [Patescibacteria group bacterium]|nr:hypothetical protein [Patescibacteria group bacterium]
MPKIGPKESQRRALREADTPAVETLATKEVMSHSRASTDIDNTSPQVASEPPGAIPDELVQKLIASREKRNARMRQYMKERRKKLRET